MTKLEAVISLIGRHMPLQKKQLDKMVDVLTAEERFRRAYYKIFCR